MLRADFSYRAVSADLRWRPACHPARPHAGAPHPMHRIANHGPSQLKTVRCRAGSEQIIHCVRWMAGGRSVLSGSTDGTLRRWTLSCRGSCNLADFPWWADARALCIRAPFAQAAMLRLSLHILFASKAPIHFTGGVSAQSTPPQRRGAGRVLEFAFAHCSSAAMQASHSYSHA